VGFPPHRDSRYYELAPNSFALGFAVDSPIQLPCPSGH
jgi:hypothetical protein